MERRKYACLYFVLAIFSIVKSVLSAEGQVYQSNVGLVYIPGDDDLSFEMKDRIVNGSLEIFPTRTLTSDHKNASLQDNSVIVKIEDINQQIIVKTEDINQTVANLLPVPTINAMYVYDQSAVKILVNYITFPQNLKRMMQEHLRIVKRYINEWIELIEDSVDRSVPDGYFRIPKAIWFHDLSLRMANRVRYDLPLILDFSTDPVWKEAVVDRVRLAEAKAGINSMDESYLRTSSDSIAISARNYNIHPFEFYSSSQERIRLEDFVSVASFAWKRRHFSSSLQWIEAAKSLASGISFSVWTNILEQNQLFSETYPDSSKFYESLETFRREVENERINYVREEMKKLDKILETEPSQEVENGGRKESKAKFEILYLEILHDAIALQHDQFRDSSQYDDYFVLFPKPIREESVSNQSTKVNNERYLRNCQPYDEENEIRLNHEKLCRGVENKSVREMSNLFCRLDSRKSPYLLLMPVKLEEISKGPEIFFLHNVLTDQMIQTFQQLTFPIMHEANTLDAGSDTVMQNTAIRKSSLGWLPDTLSEDAFKLSRLVEAITGLHATDELETGTEALQVNAYGAGGFYVPHIDPLNLYKHLYENHDETIHKKLEEDHRHGDRVATFMVYMNDKVVGGRTVFPLLNLSVEPEKGSAIFWWNLHFSGKVESRSLHAGCPVLGGTKWIANKWIGERAQIFVRPCKLSRNM